LPRSPQRKQQRRSRPPDGEVVLLLFNTLAREGRFWGNTELAMLSGELVRRGIDNRQWVLLMRPDDEDRNAATVEEFLAEMRVRRPAYVVHWATWLPWLPDALRRECGAKVLGLDPAQPGDIPEGLRGLDTFEAVITTVAGTPNQQQAAQEVDHADAVERFTPRFDYRFVGADGPVIQDMAFVAILACPYAARIQDNPLYRDLELGREVAAKGCAYCNAAGGHRPLAEDERRRQLVHQVRVLQRELPDLREIAIPFPEDYIHALAGMVRDADELGLRPVTFSGQFNAESVARQEGALRELLGATQGGDFDFHVAVIGLESFSDDDLARFNRGRERDVRQALAVLRRLRSEYDPERFMPTTVGSFILFHPWQTLANLRHSVDAMRAERVDSLFRAINVNDVRFHPGVAMYHLAVRDGLVRDGSGDGDAVHDVPLGGYFEERPWRFADQRAAAVHRLFTALMERTEQRVGLLDACLRAVEDSPDDPPQPAAVVGALERLSRMAQDRGAPGGERRVLSLAGASNVGYGVELDAGLTRVEAVDQGLAALERAGGIAGALVTLCGPEPLLRKDLPAWIGALHSAGASGVEVLTHGRMLAYPRHTAGLLDAGVGAVSVLLHHPAAAAHDAAVRVPGAFAQATDGLRRLVAASRGRARATVAVVVTRANVDQLDALVDLAAQLGADELRLLTPWSTLPLGELDSWLDPLERAMNRASARGLLTGIDRHFRAEIVRDRQEDDG